MFLTEIDATTDTSVSTDWLETAEAEGRRHLCVLDAVIAGRVPAPPPSHIVQAIAWMKQAAPGLYAEWEWQLRSAG